MPAFPGSGSAGTNGAIHMNQMTVCYSDFLPDLWVVLIYSEIETILLCLSSPSPSSVGSKIGSQQLNWIFLISLLVWFGSAQAYKTPPNMWYISMERILPCWAIDSGLSWTPVSFACQSRVVGSSDELWFIEKWSSFLG